MELVLGMLWKDLILAAVLGAVGGVGLGLLQEKGFEMPHWYRETETGVSFADLGFISDVLIGALAAVITFALNPPAGILQLISSAITAGIGGSAILKGYIKGTAVRQQANRAEMYRTVAAGAARGEDVEARLTELEEADKLVMQRWGPR
jgi:hypothetical protein